MNTPEEIVRALLSNAGIDVPDDEVRELVAIYPPNRKSLDALYHVPMEPDEPPQLFFSPRIRPRVTKP